MKRAADIDFARLISIVAICLACTLFAFEAVRFWHYGNDDAYITFRYARNLAQGLGPVFNPGERVEGYTKPSLMVLCAAVYALFGPGAVPPFAKLLGAVAALAAVVLASGLAGAVFARGDRARLVAAPLAAGIVAICPGFALNSVSGLETGLFAALIAAAAWTGALLLGDGRWRGAGVLFALAALTRPETPALFAAWWIAAAATRVPELRRRLGHRPSSAPGAPAVVGARRPA